MSFLLMTDPHTPTTPPVVRGHALTEVIGRGASSTVWSGTSDEDGEVVAVKVTSPAVQQAQYVIDIAAREQAILQRVVSDHVVRLHETIALEDGSVALVIDLADGGSLQDLVTIRGPLDPGEVVTIFTPIATTLGELHAAGVIHSDVSPGNILFTHAGKPMLSDFDAARLVGEQHPHTVSGTTGFVAPEVYRGALPTEASDVWSLAALAWYALTGGTPPPAGDIEAAASSAVGPDFAGVLVPLLAADPGARPRAAAAAVAIYRATVATPVRLAGRNPDPAAAMTHRIRQEAASEVLSVDTRPGRQSSRPGRQSARSVAGVAGQLVAGASSSRGGAPKKPRQPLSPMAKVAIIMAAAVLFVAGLLFLMAKVGDRPVTTGSSTRSAAPSTVAPTKPAPSTSAPLSPAAELQADPQTVIQRLADARAAALMKGAPAGLLAAEAKDSSVYRADVKTLGQLTAAKQTYANLVFHVRSAEIVRADGTTAQVLAVIDRAVYTIVGPGPARRQLPAQEGHAFQYVLTLTPQGWRLTDVEGG